MSRVVLIVEDSEQCAVTLEIALTALPGTIVSRFSSGEEALEFLRSATGAVNVCAVLTDLHMPRMDGFELIGRIRSLAAGLPIIVLSADTDPATPERVRQLGANAFFSKPFSPGEVRKKLEQLLNAKPTSEF